MTIYPEELTTKIIDRLMKMKSNVDYNTMFNEIDDVVYKYCNNMVGKTIDEVFSEQEKLNRKELVIEKGFGIPLTLRGKIEYK